MENNRSYFHLGNNTLKVPMELHRQNRAKLLDKLLKEPNFSSENTVVLLEGGKLETRHDTDHEILFRQESYFHYLFGVKECDFYGAIDVHTKKSMLFIPLLPEAWSVWMGKIHPPEYFVKLYEVDECYYTKDIEKVFKEKGIKRILILHGENTDSDKIHPGATFEGIKEFEVDCKTLFPVLQECRVIKSELELEVMRYVVKVTCDAHKAVMKAVRPNTMEYEMESLFCHHTYKYGGCRHQSYTCICCSGDNSAILHYGHAGAPNAKQMLDGEILMFDMGGEYHCYGADVSRSFPVNGKFTKEQREVYETVLASVKAVQSTMKAGVSWPEMHILANRVICEYLKKFEFLKGDVDEMMAHHVGSLFMPHGLGHLLGIDTHDVGGYVQGMQRSALPGLCSLRMGRVLEENMVITVEPGVYFIKSLIEKGLNNENQRKFLNMEKIEKFYGFGGIRIEDDIVVKKDGIENLSASCPVEIDEIEKLMAEGRESEGSVHHK